MYLSGVTSTGNNYGRLYIVHVICKDIYSNKFGTLFLCHNTKVQDIEMVRSLQSSIEAAIHSLLQVPYPLKVGMVVHISMSVLWCLMLCLLKKLALE